MRIGVTRVFAAVAAISVTVSGVVAEAQQADRRTTTVMDRKRPETDPLGVRAGGFVILPSITISETYDDNIFADETGTVDDLITDIEPQVIASSNWNRHALKLYAMADFGLHADRGDEDWEDYVVGADGRLDILGDTFVAGRLRLFELHEDRASPDDANGSEPGEYSILEPELGVFHRSNRISLEATGKLRRYDFDDVPGTGIIINHDDRDRDRYDITLRAGYEIAPEYEAFVRVNINQTDYDDAIDDNGFNRDSDGYEVVAGARIDLSGVTFGDVFAGYVVHDVDDAALQKIDGMTFGADLTWNVTPLTTIKLGVARTVEETTQGNAAGVFSTNFDASVDHELLRSLILSAHAGLGSDDFEGITREDDYLRFGFGGKYLVNRNLNVVLRYDYVDRSSNIDGADFDTNLIMLRVVGQL